MIDADLQGKTNAIQLVYLINRLLIMVIHAFQINKYGDYWLILRKIISIFPIFVHLIARLMNNLLFCIRIRSRCCNACCCC